MGDWEKPRGGIQLPRGSIFDRLRSKRHHFRLYQENLSLTSFPIVLALANISYAKDMHHLRDFADDLKSDYYYPLTLIEPDYGTTINGSFRSGSSQHPMDGMRRGEELIKHVYESIRSVDSIWEKSMLIVTYDEHGGFYDSAKPPEATPPGDIGHPGGPLSTNGFLFDRYGVRVPAVVVSPWIPKGEPSTTVYDHTSILKTVEEILHLDPLTHRDDNAQSLLPLTTETRPRSDCPRTLGASAVSTEAVAAPPSADEVAHLDEQPLPKQGNIWGFLAIANKVEHEPSGGTEAEREEINRRYLAIEKLGHARKSMETALAKMRGA